MKQPNWGAAIALACVWGWSSPLIAQVSKGNVHPATRRATRVERADSGQVLEHLVLTLKASEAQEQELEQLIADQSDPESENYRKYLTPEEFGARFGVGAAELMAITNWLQSQGLAVEEIPAGNRSIVFRGTLGDVGRAFRTELKQYTVDGKKYLANASEPVVPAELAGSVAGVLRLHDFESQPNGKRIEPLASPNFSPSGRRSLSPADYATIYDTNPLLSSGIDGTGQAIGVIARSNIFMTDIQGFRRLFGLKANDPQLILTNADPGIKNGDVVETTLDTEWAGAIAPGATVKVIISSSGASRDGIDLSSMYAVSNNVAPILTLSYGACEAAMGATGVAFYDSLWKQASAQGQTVLVSSGDSGVAGCDGMGSASAKNGAGVNGLCSSPYATCVGGTQFVEGSNPGQYWLPADPGNTGNTAMGYIPESVWNESGTVAGGGGLYASGGGASKFFAKPAWQTGPGVPADGKRDVPDVSLTAAGHDGYTVVQGGMIGYIFSVSGTSASTPAFAGMVALVNQLNKSAQGNINATLYSLAAKQAAGGAPIFHDVKTGDNSVPGQAGFAATTGYDLATGLGSVDANLMATLWNYSTPAKAAALSVYANPVTLSKGGTVQTVVTTTVNGLKSAVALSVSGLPSGVTASFAPASIASPGAGTSMLKLVAGTSIAPGIYTVTLKATAGAKTATSTFALTIATPTFALNYGGGLYPSVMFGPDAPFAPQTINLQLLPSNGFNAPIALSASGMPAGMTVQFSQSTVNGGVVSSSVATVSVASTVKGGSYPFTITATGGGVTQTVNYRADVFVKPSCSLTPDVYALALPAGGTAKFTLNCVAVKPSTSLVNLTFGGAPGGVTATLSSSSVTAGQTLTISLAATNGVTPGTSPLSLRGTEDSGARQDLSLYVAVATPVFSLSMNPGTVTAAAGTTTSFVAQVTPEPGFNKQVMVWIGGRPQGVAAAFSPGPNGGPSQTITLTLDPTTVPGTYPLTIGATANTGFSRTLTSTLTVLPPPTLNVTANSTALSLKIGGSVAVVLTSKPGGTFNAAVAMSSTKLPAGVTATFSKTSVAAPGNGTVTMTLTANSSAKVGVYSFAGVGTGGGLSGSATVSLKVVK